MVNEIILFTILTSRLPIFDFIVICKLMSFCSSSFIHFKILIFSSLRNKQVSGTYFQYKNDAIESSKNFQSP